jgi:predicted GNAT family N-acyltransferase
MTVLRHENLSSNVSRKLIDSMDFRKGVANAFLIGQLCKADGTKEKVGPELFELAFNMFRKTRRTVGCRVVAIDCKESLISYYEQFGFRLISDINSETHLYRMAKLLSEKIAKPDT